MEEYEQLLEEVDQRFGAVSAREADLEQREAYVRSMETDIQQREAVVVEGMDEIKRQQADLQHETSQHAAKMQKLYATSKV